MFTATTETKRRGFPTTCHFWFEHELPELWVGMCLPTFSATAVALCDRLANGCKWSCHVPHSLYSRN